jgi:hypothetical protein
VDTRTVTDTNGDGDVGFSCVTNFPIVVGRNGQSVTATATRLDTSTNPDTPRDTSEFSRNVGVVAGP